MIFADTSVIVSCYVTDANSPVARPLIQSLQHPLIITDLHRLELRNALALGVFRGFHSASAASVAWGNFLADLNAGILQPVPERWALTYRLAMRLAERHSSQLGSRSLDILHVATAWQLRATEFLTFDTRQKALAMAVGLNVRP